MLAKINNEIMLPFVSSLLLLGGCWGNDALEEQKTDEEYGPDASCSETDRANGLCEVYEAEDWDDTGGCRNASNHPGASKSLFVDFGGTDTWIRWDNVEFPVDGEYTLLFGYANGAVYPRTCSILVDGHQVETVPFEKSDAWTNWRTVSKSVSLTHGNHSITVQAIASTGGPNLDYMVILYPEDTDPPVDLCPDNPFMSEPGPCGCELCDDDPRDCGGLPGDGVIQVGDHDFSIGFIPDVQKLTKGDGERDALRAVMEFFVRNQCHLNLLAVSSVGDLVQETSSVGRWNRLMYALQPLDDADIPFIPVCGNHDGCGQNHYYGTPEEINYYFDYSVGNPQGYRGSYTDDNYPFFFGGIENSYYTFNFNGRDFMVLTVEYGPTSRIDEIWNDWATNILNSHPNHHTIYVTHEVNVGGHRRRLCAHDNIFLSVQGHAHGRRHRDVIDCSEGDEDEDDIDHFIDHFYFAFPHPRDDDPLPPKAAVGRYYTFKTEDNEVCMRTYSVRQARLTPDEPHLTDSECQATGSAGPECHEYCWDYDMSL